MPQPFKIGGVCLNQTPIDWENNLSNIRASIDEAKASGIELLCLPELCITGYGCEDLFLGEWIYETALEKLFEVVEWTDQISVAVGLPMRFKDENYNVACLISDKKILGFYAKQRLANDGVHYEPRWFSAWQSGKTDQIKVRGNHYPFGHCSFKLKNYLVGFEICEDAWREDRPMNYSEHLDIVLNPSASHFAFKKAHYREELVKSGSKKFDCIYLYANLLGNEAGRMIYDGDILIARAGKLIARNRRLSFKKYKLLGVELSSDKVSIKPDFASQNEEFAHAASLALFDYLRKSGSKGFVLSLSGGADSSCIATLVTLAIRHALDQLGIEEFEERLGVSFHKKTEKHILAQLFTTAYQATVNSSKSTYDSAAYLAKSLGVTFHAWEIDKCIQNSTEIIEKVIGRKLSWDTDDITLQNIQARSRSPLIWMLANLNNALLLATSNRSEGDVGYATMDGDTSGSISPIAGVSKHFIMQWLHYAERELGFEGLNPVNQLTPTAELRPEDQMQTDEEDLMPYEVLVKIEREVVLRGKSPQGVMDALLPHYDKDILSRWILKFLSLWTQNQWKRERYAPGFHFDDFNIDPRSWYRFPILNGRYEEELKAL